MELNQFQYDQLTSGGDCFQHHHSEDRRPNHDTVNSLQDLESVILKSANYTIRYEDDWIAVDTTSTMTLPVPKGGKEWKIVNVGSGVTVTITAPTNYTINGVSSITVTTQWQGKTIKSLNTTGYVAI